MPLSMCWRLPLPVAAWLVCFVVACGSAAPPLGAVDGGATVDAGVVDAGVFDAGVADTDAGLSVDAGVDKAAMCASTFGAALTNAYGRIDGTVHAVVPPAHPTCALPNNDHLVLQVDMAGATYRMVLNVRSDRAGQDPRVHFAQVRRALPGRAWQEGWWPGEIMDYASTLGVHSGDLTPYEMADLVNRITEPLIVGARVSVYTSSSGGASAHLIHRNTPGRGDGAIVIDPTGMSPLLLLFRFADQTF